MPYEFISKEHLWLKAGITYELFPDRIPLISDYEWDTLCKELLDNYEKLSAIFRHQVSRDDLSTGSASIVHSRVGIFKVFIDSMEK